MEKGRMWEQVGGQLEWSRWKVTQFGSEISAAAPKRKRSRQPSEVLEVT